MSSLLALIEPMATERAREGFSELMVHVCQLYTCGESSSVSEFEAYEIAESVLFVLGLDDDTVQETIHTLASADIVALWTRKRQELEARIPGVMDLWQQAVRIMPPIRNIALRDTLESIGKLPSTYDTFFAAHEVPCNIDYPLSKPVSDHLKGLDYVEAWLRQLLSEAQFLSLFDLKELEEYLGAWCPDHCGLLINLYEPIHEAWRNRQIPMKEYCQQT